MGRVFREVQKTPEFERDIKKLSKRFPTLEEDLQILIGSSFELSHHLQIDNGGIEAIAGMQVGSPAICKVTKFACRSLPGRGARSGLRLIYAYWEEEDRVDLIELYFKSDQETEDRERIQKYLHRLRR
ncbi:MAG: hypothetical protein NTU59_01240 [Coprothermobacterota bacterium]|nr:hypothetical protein [Coprothermobacterota bacterium]